MYQAQNSESSKQMITNISSLPTKNTFQQSTNNSQQNPVQNMSLQPQNEILGEQHITTPSYNPNINTNTNTNTNPNMNNTSTLQNNTTVLQQQQTQSLNSIPNEDIQHIMNNIHNSPDNSVTQLPIRDIPRSQQQIVSDIQSRPNYIPKQAQHDPKNKFIEQVHHKNDELKNLEFQRHVHETSLISQLLDRLYIPIVFSCIFFIFTIPSFNKKLYSFLPSLFVKETKLSIYGNILKAIVFGFISLSCLYGFEKLDL